MVRYRIMWEVLWLQCLNKSAANCGKKYNNECCDLLCCSYLFSQQVSWFQVFEKYVYLNSQRKGGGSLHRSVAIPCRPRHSSYWQPAGHFFKVCNRTFHFFWSINRQIDLWLDETPHTGITFGPLNLWFKTRYVCRGFWQKGGEFDKRAENFSK